MKHSLHAWAYSVQLGFMPSLHKKSIGLFFVIIASLLFSLQSNAQSVTIGPSATTTAIITYGPMTSGTTAARYNRHAYIYPASLFPDITNGDRIDAFAFKKAVTTAPTGASVFKIYVKNINLTDWGTGNVNWTTEIANATLVYNASPNTILGSTSGFKTFPFTSGYVFNTTNGNNLAILVEYTQTAASTAITWIYDTPTGVPAYATNQTKYISSTTTSTPANLLSSTNANHPQLRIDYRYSLNTNIDAITTPSGACNASSDSIRVRIKNTGFTSITSAIVNWEFNGVAQTPFNFVGSIPENGTAVVAIGYKTFPVGQPINIKAWTSLPNGSPDKFPSNDTLSRNAAGPALVGGTYTIGGSTTDYATLIDAVKDLNQRGICGPVVFNVDALAGPYIGQIELQQIPGANASNTITFNGNGATIIDTINASKVNNKHIVYLNGTDYCTFDNFIITYEETSLYCLPVVIGNDANYNRIRNCSILMDPNTTTVDFSAISFTGSSANYILPTTASNNIIENNIIRGGYAGVAIVGTTATPLLSKGNIIRNNSIRDHYLYGIYVSATDSTQLISNDIYKPSRITYAGNYGVYLTGNSQRLVADKNRIHDIFLQVPTSTSNFYAFFVTANDAKAGKEMIIKNNLIYNLKGNGTQYGLHNNSSDSIWYFHNTVQIDNPAATAGGAVGIYATAAASGVKYLNNNINISKGGNGNKHAVFVNTADVTAMINYNNLFIDTTIGKTGQRNTGTFVAAPFITLASWKTANGGIWDQNSVAGKSLFANVAGGDFTPNSFDLNNIGTPISAADIDFNGVSRNPTNPDPGAYEFTPILNDAGIIGMSLVNGSCAGTNPISFKLKNYGANDLTSVQINWKVNGVLKTPFSYSGLLGSGADTLVAVGTQTIALDSAYTISAWTSIPNTLADNRMANDTFMSVNYKAAMVGTYTVGGVGAKYPTISAAATDLNNRGVCGPVIIDVKKTAGPYIEQVKINALVGTSAVNTVKFLGHGSALNFSSNTSAIRYGFYLDGSDYVTIDSFVITPSSGVNNYGWAIHLGTLSDYNTISNNIINLNNDIITQNFTGIALTGSTTVLNSVGGLFVGNVIEKNTINGGYYNINIYGIAGSNALTRANKILDNKMFDPYHYSVTCFNQDSVEVSRNDMSRSKRVTSVNFVGAYFNGVGGSTKVDGNRIHDAFNANEATTQSPYGVYFTNCPHSAGREGLVSNNVIYNFYGSGPHTGLYAGGTSSYIRYYNNTVSLDNKLSTTGIAYGFYQTGATTNIDVKNNNISITRGGPSAKYGIYLATNPPGVTSNYNNFYINATAGNVGYYSSAKLTLADWKAANTNAYDQNSTAVDPEFLSIPKNNYTANNALINNVATPLALVTKDFYGATRSGTPDVGAIEFTPTANDVEVITVVGPTNICLGANPVTVRVKNQGTANLTSFVINWTVNNVAQTPFTFSGSMPKYKDSIVTIGTFTGVLNNVYDIKVWSTLPNASADQNALNDTAQKTGLNTGLAGKYTIGNTPSNYESFTAAVNDLVIRGVCGPVVFNVDPSVGNYEEKVTIPSILGASEINTITFKGNYATLSYLVTATADRGVVTLNGADYVIIDSLNIELDPASTYGYPVVLTNGADYNVIKNSNLKSINAGSSNYAGLVIGGISSISTASTSKYNVIENNNIIGGYYCVSIYGTSGNNSLSRANTLRNNRMLDFYYYGLYHYYSDSTQIIGNDFSRPTTTSISSTTYNMYILGASQNLLIEKNKIHNLWDQDQAGTGTLYGIYLSTGAAQTGKQSIVRNNVLYNLNNNGSHYTIYNSTSGNVVYYHNTVVMDNANATTGAGYAFYQTGSANGIEFINNNISITKGGTGLKYGIYMSTAGTPLTTNYNNIYVPNGNVGYNTSARITMTDWRAVNPAYDVNSVSVNPVFPYKNFGNLSPAAVAMDNIGTPLASVPNDILGNSRSATNPDMGAYEFTPLSDDISITKLTVESICPGNTPIVVNLRTLGFNNLISANINWSINGVVQTPLIYSGSLAPGFDTLLLLGNVNFVSTNTYNLKFWTSLPNGSTDLNNQNDTLYISNKKTGLRGVYTIGGVGANYPNLTAAAAALNTQGVCGNVTFNVNPAAGPYNEQVAFEAIRGTSDTSKIVFNGNGSLITFNATSIGARHIIKLRGTDYLTIDSFRIEMGASSTYAFPIHVLSGSNHNTFKRNTIRSVETQTSSNYCGVVFSGSESSPTTAGADMSFNVIENNRIFGGYYTMMLYGSSVNPASVKGNVIRNNKITDSYYYSIYTLGCDSTTISGNDISRPNRTSYGLCYGIYNNTNSINTLVEKNRIHNPFDGLLTSTSAFYGIYTNASDGTPGKAIVKNNLIYNVNGAGAQYGLANNGSDNIYYYNNTIILNDPISSTGIVNAFLQTGTASLGVKLTNNNFFINRPGSANRIGMYWTAATSTFESNYNNFYIVNGGGNNAVSFYTNTYPTLADWQASNTNMYDQNSVAANPLFNLASSGNYKPFSGGFDNKGIHIPDVLKDILDSARSLTAPDIGAYEFTAVGEDAGVSSLAFSTVCPGINPVSINIINSSANILSFVNVGWTVNGVAQPILNYSGSINSGSSATVTLGNYNFVQGQAYELRFWTYEPNGLVDANLTNDTLKVNNFVTALNGVYTIGGAGANYPSLVAAAQSINNAGVCGPVVFNMNPAAGPYNGQVEFGNIAGTSAINTIQLNGKGSVVTATITATENRHLIRLNGTKYMTIDSVYANINAASTFGYALVIGNNANYNTFKNSRFLSTTGTTTSFGAVIFSGSADLATTASNSSYNLFENNLIAGGYYGVSVYGTTGGNALTKGNIFRNNTIKDFYTYGIYNIYADSTQIVNNDISRPTQAATGTAYGIYCAGISQEIFIEKNKIHNMFDLLTTNTSALYGIGMATSAAQVGKYSIIKNNLLHSLNNNGTHYCLYNSSSGNVLYYNNTVVDNYSAATAGATYGFYQTGSVTGIELKNNNIVASRAGSGVKYAIYMATSTTPLISNYNNLYAPNGAVGYNTTAQTTIADWKLVLSGAFDANSVSVNPVFTYAITNNYSPTTAALDNKGTPITMVVDDITNALRDPSTPDIGAYEFSPLNNDLSIAEILYPLAGNKCGNPNDSIVLVIQNSGANTQSAFNIKVDVTGVNTTTLNKLYAGSILSGELDTITVGPYNTDLSGSIQLTSYLQLGTDAFRLNDTLRRSFVTSAASATPSANNATVCKGDKATLVATSGSNNIFRWYDAPVGGNLLATNDSLLTPIINNTSKFYVAASSGSTAHFAVGPMDITIGANGNFTNATVQYLEFDALSTFTLDSVSIYPNGPGNVEFRLLSNTGAVLQTRTVAVTTTQVMTRIPVGFVITPGTAYRLDGGPATTTGGLWRNTAGGVYPYSIPGIVTITGNSFSTTAYYYYYNWRVTGGSETCPSVRKEVTVNTAPALAGSAAAKGVIYNGIYNTGTSVNPDKACIADTLEYEVSAPTGFNNAGFGTTWTINSVGIKTNHQLNTSGTLTVTGRNIRYIVGAGDVDSSLVLSFKVKDLSTAICDTQLVRNIQIGSNLTVNLGADTTICAGQSVTLNAGIAGQSYLWSNGATTQSITVTSSSVYTVTVTNAAGCTSTDQKTVTVLNQIPLSLGADQFICSGTSTTLDAGLVSGATYLWSTGATSQTISVNSAGQYAVTISLGACSASDTIFVGINPTPVVNLGIDKSICTSDSIILDGGNVGATYLWSTGATTQTIIVKNAGTYTVTVTSAEGCVKTDDIIITHKAEPNATYTSNVINGLNWQFTGPNAAGVQYFWNFGDPNSAANTSQLRDPAHAFSAVGNYTVTLKVVNVATGCSKTFSSTINVTNVGIDQQKAFTAFYAAPNPFEGSTIIHYELKQAGSVHVEVVDMLGRIVSTIVNTEHQAIGKYDYVFDDTRNLIIPGVYQVRLTIDGIGTVIRVVKSN